jgi:benzylsuccinate CoA-transferase BbsE subunit
MRILELSDVEGAAAYCGKLFRRWGHEVIRVESSDRNSLEVPADLYLHGGKRRVALSLEEVGDRERLGALSRCCDVLLTDRSVADIERFGLLDLGGDGRPAVRLAITPFGLTGPYALAPATEASLLALGGYSHIIGDRTARR